MMIYQYENGNTALNLAVSYDKYFMIDYLLKNGADINSQNQQLLFWAVKNNNLAIIKQYLANGADINIQDEDNNTALHLAIKHENLHMVNFNSKKCWH